MTDYEYKGLMAQAWDPLRGDTSEWSDRFLFLQIIERFGQPVLDVGCGTGRLLLDYLAQGIDVDGIDNSPEMLELCRNKAKALGLSPKLYEQDMVHLDLPRSYRTILVPSSSLQLVIEPEQVSQAMRRFLAHLEPDGVLVAPFMTLWRAGDPLEQEWISSAQRPEDGATIRRVARSRYDPALECEHTEDIYQVIVNDQVVAEETHRRSPATRSYSQAQARALFEQAGFVAIEFTHEFSLEPSRPEDLLFTVLGQKPSSP
jgi:ubiquinone/menaquinone biosynthesis C-methylase UbiE